jgi:TonB family protein
MKLLTLALMLCIGGAAQTIDEAHALLARVKALGLSTLTRNDAEPLLRKAAKIWEAQDPQNPEYAQVLVLLGMIRYSRHPTNDTEGMRKDVEPLYRQAVDIYNQNAASADPSDVALALEAEADVLIKIGSSAESKPLKERAVDLRKKHVEDLQKDAPTGPSEGLQRIGGGVTAPVVVSKIEPSYSDVARFIKQQGTVQFSLVVGADGVPTRLRLVRSLGFDLDEEGLRAIRTWRFRPANRDGQPVPVIANIEVSFRLL